MTFREYIDILHKTGFDTNKVFVVYNQKMWYFIKNEFYDLNVLKDYFASFDKYVIDNDKQQIVVVLSKYDDEPYPNLPALTKLLMEHPLPSTDLTLT